VASELNRLNKVLVVMLGLLVGATAWGAEVPTFTGDHGLDSPELRERKRELRKMVKNLKRNQNKFERFMAEGRIRTTLCRKCHGEQGVSDTLGVPSLAGQNPVYLVDQFERFADGRRSEFLMSGLARSLTEQDKLRLAVYYASLTPPPPVPGNPELVSRGEVVYNSACIRCHGDDGRGELGYARLAGQRPDYVVKRLQEFRERSVAGADPAMTGQTGGLTQSDMEAVAAYTATLP